MSKPLPFLRHQAPDAFRLFRRDVVDVNRVACAGDRPEILKIGERVMAVDIGPSSPAGWRVDSGPTQEVDARRSPTSLLPNTGPAPNAPQTRDGRLSHFYGTPARSTDRSFERRKSKKTAIRPPKRANSTVNIACAIPVVYAALNS